MLETNITQHFKTIFFGANFSIWYCGMRKWTGKIPVHIFLFLIQTWGKRIKIFILVLKRFGNVCIKIRNVDFQI